MFILKSVNYRCTCVFTITWHKLNKTWSCIMHGITETRVECFCQLSYKHGSLQKKGFDKTASVVGSRKIVLYLSH